MCKCWIYLKKFLDTFSRLGITNCSIETESKFVSEWFNSYSLIEFNLNLGLVNGKVESFSLIKN